MTGTTYRCVGCREYRPRPEYQRFGLGSVCSPDCLALVRAKRKKRAPAKPADQPPPEVREVVLDRDRYRCRFCGTVYQLHLHHISYRSEGVDHSPGNLITLCSEHHAVVHTDKRRWQPVCRAYVGEVAHGQQRFLLAIDRQINGR